VTNQPDISPPAASILSVGAVTPLGCDMQSIAHNLARPAAPAAPSLRVSDAFLSDPALSRRMRRADRFARMAVIAALDAWGAAQSTCEGIAMEKVGLIVATGFGPHCRGFRFIDGILDCGDSDALPTDFSHSVHGAAAAYITESLELRGPSLTCTDFEIGFEQAVLLAQCWLADGRCDRVVVGAVEEVGDVLIQCTSRMLGDERFVPGEGAVFLTLAPGEVAGIARLEAMSEPRDCDLMMLDFPTIGSQSAQEPPFHARCATTFSPYFGHSPSSSAFQLLGGLLSLGAGRPLGRLIRPPSDDAARYSGGVDNAATFKPSCSIRVTSFVLTKPRL
jgi:3-oxoacyl-[acyl-carrier-protein] synthase II